jgi:hypothetical protein
MNPDFRVSETWDSWDYILASKGTSVANDARLEGLWGNNLGSSY